MIYHFPFATNQLYLLVLCYVCTIDFVSRFTRGNSFSPHTLTITNSLFPFVFQ